MRTLNSKSVQSLEIKQETLIANSYWQLGRILTSDCFVEGVMNDSEKALVVDCSLINWLVDNDVVKVIRTIPDANGYRDSAIVFEINPTSTHKVLIKKS